MRDDLARIPERGLAFFVEGMGDSATRATAAELDSLVKLPSI